MAPQTPDDASATSDTNNNSTLESTPNVTSAVKEADAFQRRKTNRKRGWHDYQLLVSGYVKIFDSLCTVPTGCTYDDDYLNGWNTFNANGTDNIVNFITAPASYGRSLNYKSTDKVIQATDGAVIVIYACSFVEKLIDYAFEQIKNSYEGKNATYYDRDYYRKVPAPPAKELAALKSRTKRPVAIVVVLDRFYDINSSEFDVYLKVTRQACAKFMEGYGDANDIRIFEITLSNCKEDVNKVVSTLISDLEKGRGIKFSPPTVRPWDPDVVKKFKKLNLVKADRNKNRGGLRAWTWLINKFVTSGA